MTRTKGARLKNFFVIQTMSLASGVVNNSAIDNLVQSSFRSETKYLRLEWIPCAVITDIEPTQIDNIYHAIYKDEGGVEETTIMLLLLGNGEICTPSFVSAFARIYALPTHKYNNVDNNFR